SAPAGGPDGRTAPRTASPGTPRHRRGRRHRRTVAAPTSDRCRPHPRQPTLPRTLPPSPQPTSLSPAPLPALVVRIPVRVMEREPTHHVPQRARTHSTLG